MVEGILTGFADTARGRIYFEVSGPDDAPAMMFLAMPTSRGGMAEMGDAYRAGLDGDYRLLICDYPAGAGGSERHEDAPPMTPDQVAADYIAIADAAGFDRFICAGYSIGGNMSVQITLRYPDRVSALIVGGWPALGADFKTTFEHLALGVPEVINPDTSLGQVHAANPELRQSMRNVARDFVDYYWPLQDWDDREAAQSLAMPRLNFADAEDMGYPDMGTAIDVGPALVRNEAALREMGWETHIIRTGAGPNHSHIAAVQPDLVVPILREFLGRIFPKTACV